jgi:peroxiredoxin Q/BCP
MRAAVPVALRWKEAPMIREAELAPDFELLSDKGEVVSLEDYRGSRVVLWFFPHDNIPGFLRHARAFRDRQGQFEAADAIVVAVTPDSPAALRELKDKFGLPFTLLSDPTRVVARLYGVWGETQVAARHYLNVIPTTFLLDEDGLVRRVWPDVGEAEEHEDLVLEALEEDMMQ